MKKKSYYWLAKYKESRLYQVIHIVYNFLDANQRENTLLSVGKKDYLNDLVDLSLEIAKLKEVPGYIDIDKGNLEDQEEERIKMPLEMYSNLEIGNQYIHLNPFIKQ